MSFYVYFHCKPDGTPFYVGKGSGRRSSNFKYNRNRHYKNIVAKYGKENIKIAVIPCSSEKDAFSQEITLIKAFRDIGYALTNMTDGGEGCSADKETRKRMSDTQKGRRKSAEWKAKLSAANKGKPMSAEQRSIRSATCKAKCIRPPSTLGRKHGPQTAEHKANNLMARRKTYLLRSVA